MAYTVENLIAIAKAEVGYLEKKSNSQLDNQTANAGSANYTKYARDLARAGYYQASKQGYAWCDVFVDWCFLQLCNGDAKKAEDMICQTGDYGAGCGYSAGYYKNQGRFSKEPKIGDQIFFWNASKNSVVHTGIVVDLDDTYIYTIEGNTSSTAGVVANGGGVFEKKYKRNYARLYGFGHPKYDASGSSATSPAAPASTLKKVYLSPSNQTKNIYAYGNTNEAAQCEKIAEACRIALQRANISVMVSSRSQSMATRCTNSNNFKADIHVPIHTNAFNKKTSGTRLMSYNTSGEGYKACKAIFNVLAPLTPGTSENISAKPGLYEIKTPKAPTAYIEVDFHDVSSVAKWIIENVEEIGETIAKGICNYLGVKYVEPSVAPTPTPTPTPTPNKPIIDVDGIWGSETTRRLQQIFGTTVDGEVSNQHRTYKSQNPGLSTGWEWLSKPNGKGSALLKALQKWAGLTGANVDGEWGPTTCKAIQKKLGTTQDGKVSKPSTMVRALQKWANEQ